MKFLQAVKEVPTYMKVPKFWKVPNILTSAPSIRASVIDLISDMIAPPDSDFVRMI